MLTLKLCSSHRLRNDFVVGEGSTHTHNRFTAVDFVRDNPGEPVQKKHSPTHPSWSSYIPICLLHLLQSMASFLLNPRALHRPLHTPYISLPNHCLLFVAHAHTIATCFTVVPRLCHLILVSVSTLYLGLCLAASHHTSILPFSSLPSEVSPHFL